MEPKPLLEIKPRYQPPQVFSLEQVVSLLKSGEFLGDEPARLVGLESWKTLSEIEGITLPVPPPQAYLAPQSGSSEPEIRPVRRKSNLYTFEELRPLSFRPLGLYIEATNLSRFLIALLGLSAFFTVVAFLLGGNDMETTRPTEPADALANLSMSDVALIIVALLNALLNVLIAFVFCWWIVRMNKNVRALGAVGLRNSPGWAVGWFFVPIWCLWRPYEAMRQLWSASHDPAGWELLKPSWLVTAWWTLWLASIGISRVLFRMLTANPNEVSRLELVALFADVLILGSIFSAIILVRTIARAQEETNHRAILDLVK